jgi:hypothetical protein
MHVDIILRGTHDSNAKFKQMLHEKLNVNVMPIEYLCIAFEQEKLNRVLSILKAYDIEENIKAKFPNIDSLKETLQDIMHIEKVDMKNIKPDASEILQQKKTNVNNQLDREKKNPIEPTQYAIGLIVLGSRPDDVMEVKTASGIEKREMI